MKYPIVIYNGKQQPHSWCKWSVSRVRNRNNSTNIRFIGDTGSGKSWSALFMAEEMARMMGYQIEESDIYFSISDVIKKVHKDEPKPGTIFFIDEQQVEGASGEYNNLRGKAYVTFFSTCRSKRYIIISTMPFADMIIKKVRRFFHVEIETINVDYTNNAVNTKPRYLEYHKHMDKVYRKNLVISIRDPTSGLIKSTKVSRWVIPKPSDELIQIYEQKKAEFQHKTYGQLIKDLDKFENKDNIDEEDMKKTPEAALSALTEYQKAIFDLFSEHPEYTNKDMSAALIEKGFNSSSSKVSMNIGFMKRKGIIIVKRRKHKNRI